MEWRNCREREDLKLTGNCRLFRMGFGGRRRASSISSCDVGGRFELEGGGEETAGAEKRSAEDEDRCHFQTDGRKASERD